MADPFNLKRFNLLSGDVTVRNSLISLGGRRVTDVIPGANILDIRIGAATIKQITSDRGYRSGYDYVRRRHTTRRIEVDIELPLDRNTYPDNVNLIRAWADRPEPQQLLLSTYRQWKIDVNFNSASSSLEAMSNRSFSSSTRLIPQKLSASPSGFLTEEDTSV